MCRSDNWWYSGSAGAYQEKGDVAEESDGTMSFRNLLKYDIYSHNFRHLICSLGFWKNKLLLAHFMLAYFTRTFQRSNHKSNLSLAMLQIASKASWWFSTAANAHCVASEYMLQILLSASFSSGAKCKTMCCVNKLAVCSLTLAISDHHLSLKNCA